MAAGKPAGGRIGPPRNAGRRPAEPVDRGHLAIGAMANAFRLTAPGCASTPPELGNRKLVHSARTWRR